MSKLMRVIEAVEEWRAENHSWFSTPSMTNENPDTLSFLFCEIAELIDAELRESEEYNRASSKDVSIRDEVGDILLMLSTLYLQVEQGEEQGKTHLLPSRLTHLLMQEMGNFWRYDKRQRLESIELCIMLVLDEYKLGEEYMINKLAKIKEERCK